MVSRWAETTASDGCRSAEASRSSSRRRAKVPSGDTTNKVSSKSISAADVVTPGGRIKTSTCGPSLVDTSVSGTSSASVSPSSQVPVSMSSKSSRVSSGAARSTRSPG
jgi:hypothetical protein